MGNLRTCLINALADLNYAEITAGCRERFEIYLANPASLAPDLRPSVLAVVGRYADEKTWSKLHELGLKTTSIEEKQNYYNALAEAIDPKLVKKTLPIALTDELPTSRAVFLVPAVARDSGHPDIAWEFAKANMKTLLAKIDAAGANRYAPGLFTFFSDDLRANELKSYAKNNLSAASAREVEKVVLFREIDGVLEKFRAVALALVFLMNHQVLQQNDEAAFGRADCEKQIDHSHNRAVASQHEDAPAARLFENEPQTTKLFVLVRPKIAFLSEQSAQHFRQLVQVGLGRWFDYDMFAHRFYCLSQSRTRWQSLNQRSTVVARGAIDNGFLTPSVTALKSGRSYFPVL